MDLSSTEIANKVSYDYYNYLNMAYYSKDTCVTVGDAGCTTDYNSSNIKQVVDVWSNSKLKSSDLKDYQTGYSARLITLDDLVDNLGYTIIDGQTYYIPTADVTPSWVYNSHYWYWTMSQFKTYPSDHVWIVDVSGNMYGDDLNDVYGTVRPVITIKKSAI